MELDLLCLRSTIETQQSVALLEQLLRFEIDSGRQSKNLREDAGEAEPSRVDPRLFSAHGPRDRGT